MEKKDLLIYMDIPFCPVKCAGCSKPALQPAAKEREMYAAALAKEVEASAHSVDDFQIGAVYVGGGIPGHMMDEQLGELLHVLPEWYPLSAKTEVTLKVHPGMVSVDTLRCCSRGRVTRLSIEYVTSNISEYETLGRFLSPSAMDITKQVIGNKTLDLSFDVLAGLPGQTWSTLRESISRCLTYGAVHMNLITFSASGEMTDESARSGVSPRKRLPMPDEVKEWLEKAGEMLAAHGFAEYLPGRFALPGKECRYYLQEKAGVQYLGFGLGACSVLDGIASGTTLDYDCYVRWPDRPDKTLRYVRRI